jgi:hypothetical protein
MKREDREKDIAARRENYQRGLIELNQAISGFADLTGVSLLGDVDVTGRHMGERPYLKITAERLVEITAKIQGDVERISADLLEIKETITADSVVLQFDRRVRSVLES